MYGIFKIDQKITSMNTNNKNKSLKFEFVQKSWSLLNTFTVDLKKNILPIIIISI